MTLGCVKTCSPHAVQKAFAQLSARQHRAKGIFVHAFARKALLSGMDVPFYVRWQKRSEPVRATYPLRTGENFKVHHDDVQAE
jgi:hypothetical protein